jgi:type II secretion system protein H
LEGAIVGLRFEVRRGFTLVEVGVVLVVLALAAAVAVPAFRRLFEEDELTTAVGRVEMLFKVARDSAIASGTPVTVMIDSVTGHVWIDAPRAESAADALTASPVDPFAPVFRMSAIPRREEAVDTGQSLELPPSVRLELTRARARFTFTPGGGAFADSLMLTTNLGAVLVTADPWTGDAVVR